MPDETLFTIVCPHCQTEYRVRPVFAGKKVSCKRCGNAFLAAGKGTPLSRPPDIGTLAVKYNLITQAQLDDVLAVWVPGSSEEAIRSLETLFFEKKILTQGQIEALKLTDLFRKATVMSRKFGALALERGMITQADLDRALEKQGTLFKETRKVHYVKDILLEQGSINQSDQEALVLAMSPSAAPDIPPASSPEPETAPKEESVSSEEAQRHYDLILAEDRMSAALLPREAGVPPVSLAAGHALLKSKGVVHGVLPDADLGGYLSLEKKPDGPKIIASGTPPVPGTDAIIIYHFTKDQKVGTVGAHGVIDFKDRGAIPFVQAGALLMEKVPGRPGTPGCDIFGTGIPVAPPSDIKFLLGSGVELSDDKLKVFAKTDGQPNLTLGGRLSVASDLTINGDVDLKSGHIDFEGDVKVTGTIQSGFKVKGANIFAKEIMASEIIAKGDVTVAGGVIGAVIKAQGEVKAKYIKHGKISTFGDVLVEKEITDSSIDTSGACRLAKGKIIASELSAKQGVEAMDIGTDLSLPCKLAVGVDDHVEAELEGIEKAIVRRTERFEQMMRSLEEKEEAQQELHRKIAELAQVQDRALVEQRQLRGDLAATSPETRAELEARIAALGERAVQAENDLGDLFSSQDRLTLEMEDLQGQADQVREDIEELRHEADAIRHWAKSQKKAAVVKVLGTMVQGTVISGPHARAIMKENYRNVTVRELKNTDPDSSTEWEIKVQNK